MLLPVRTEPPPGLPLACGLDTHFGPFRELPELRGWLGAEWVTCSACRSTLTRATAEARKHAA